MTGNEGETTCTTGDNLDGEGAGPGDTLIPGDILDTGEVGNCPLEDCEEVLTTTMAAGLPEPPVFT